MVVISFGNNNEKEKSVENNKIENKELDVNNFYYEINFMRNRYGNHYTKELENNLYEAELIDVLYKDNNTKGIIDYLKFDGDCNSNVESFYLVFKIEDEKENKIFAVEHFFVKDLDLFKEENKGKKDFYFEKIKEKDELSKKRALGLAKYVCENKETEINSYDLFKKIGEKINKKIFVDLKIDYNYKKTIEDKKKFIHFPMYVAKFTDKTKDEIIEIVKNDELHLSEVNQVSQNEEKDVEEVNQVSQNNELLAKDVFGVDNNSDFSDVEFFED